MNVCLYRLSGAATASLLLVFTVACPSTQIPMERAFTLHATAVCGQLFEPNCTFTLEKKSPRLWHWHVEGTELVVENVEMLGGIAPVWFEQQLPPGFLITAMAVTEKEGLDGGWGFEFASPDKFHAYRVLLYSSGRFCIDRFFEDYPEFVHCVALQPEVNTGETANLLELLVDKDMVRVAVNGKEIASFSDNRIKTGFAGLAVAGAGTAVRFKHIGIWKPGKKGKSGQTVP